MIRFCRDCNNLLRAEEDKSARQLMYKCDMCGGKERAQTATLFQLKLKKEAVSKLEAVDGALVNDPTLPRTNNAFCTDCGGTEAVFFQDSDSGRDSDMKLIYICTNCRHKWLN